MASEPDPSSGQPAGAGHWRGTHTPGPPARPASGTFVPVAQATRRRVRSCLTFVARTHLVVTVPPRASSEHRAQTWAWTCLSCHSHERAVWSRTFRAGRSGPEPDGPPSQDGDPLRASAGPPRGQKRDVVACPRPSGGAPMGAGDRGRSSCAFGHHTFAPREPSRQAVGEAACARSMRLISVTRSSPVSGLMIVAMPSVRQVATWMRSRAASVG